VRGRRLRSRNSTIVSAIVTVISSADTASSQPAFPARSSTPTHCQSRPVLQEQCSTHAHAHPIMCSCTTMVVTSGPPCRVDPGSAAPCEPTRLAHEGSGARGRADGSSTCARDMLEMCSSPDTRRLSRPRKRPNDSMRRTLPHTRAPTWPGRPGTQGLSPSRRTLATESRQVRCSPVDRGSVRAGGHRAPAHEPSIALSCRAAHPHPGDSRAAQPAVRTCCCVPGALKQPALPRTLP